MKPTFVLVLIFVWAGKTVGSKTFKEVFSTYDQADEHFTLHYQEAPWPEPGKFNKSGDPKVSACKHIHEVTEKNNFTCKASEEKSDNVTLRYDVNGQPSKRMIIRPLTCECKTKGAEKPITFYLLKTQVETEVPSESEVQQKSESGRRTVFGSKKPREKEGYFYLSKKGIVEEYRVIKYYETE